MKLEDFLAPSDAMLGIKAVDKNGLLRDLSHRAAPFVGVPFDQIAAEVIKREALGSTGMGEGVAIPHARLRELKKPFGVLARLKQPIDFNAIDGKPVDLVFLLLLPVASQGEQLNALAFVARTLRKTEVLRDLRRADSSDELYQTMTGELKT